MAMLWEVEQRAEGKIGKKPGSDLEKLLESFEAWLRASGHSATRANAYKNAVRNFLRGNIPSSASAFKDLTEGLKEFFRSGYSKEIGLSPSNAVQLLADYLARNGFASSTQTVYLNTLKTFLKGEQSYEDFLVPVIRHLASAITSRGLEVLADSHKQKDSLHKIKDTIAGLKEKIDRLSEEHKRLKELVEQLEQQVKGAR